MEKIYKAFIHKEKDSCYGITFPDFPGCVSAGDTFEEVVRNGKEALQLMVDAMFENGEKIPEPGEIDEKWLTEECDDIEAIAIVPVDVPTKKVRVNVSMADYLIDRIDKYAKSHGQTRSGVLTNAVLRYIEG